MTTQVPVDWLEANQQYLAARLSDIRALLERQLNRPSSQPEPDLPALEDSRVPDGLQPPPALEILAERFQLSPFERDILLLCAGVEMESRFGALCASLHGDPLRTFPTFSMALAILPGAHWSALAPAGPLRHWRLIEVGPGHALTQSPLRIDERILHYLAGLTYLDDRLKGYLAPVAAPEQDLPPSHQAIADQIIAAWERSGQRAEFSLPLIQLVGDAPAAHKAIASAVCSHLNLTLYRMPAAALPSSPAEQESLRRLWEREGLLSGNALLLDCERASAGESGNEAGPGAWIESLRTPSIVAGSVRLRTRQPLVTLEVHKPTPSEQHDLWQQALGPLAAVLDGRMEAIVSQFNLDASTIDHILDETLQHEPESAESLAALLWKACNNHSRPGLNELAQHILPLATWDDLVLPEAQLQTLREISMHVRQRLRVYETWGFAHRSARGLGISALFSGVSGTGKTMAAEVLANELQLELYRVDLSQVVSKYIGETEKNLRRVFDAAEESGAILLFDEADALFGKRSEVRDSHDRYANVEISYLLQRMEAYRGLAILTTNLKETLDPAFMRRIRFVVHFPFPDSEQRAEIWRRIFPAKTPRDGLDERKLARLNIPGGNIHNIALYAAFLAADVGEPVRMSHLLRAARVEFSKLERPLNAAELGGGS